MAETKYEKIVKPRLADIAEWKRVGWSDEDIADELHIARSTFALYKTKHEELSDALKDSKAELVQKLHGALVRCATGYQYVETKKIYERDDDGKMRHVRTEETTKTALPNVAALNLALKNFDRDNWSNDPQADKFKREELELKKKAIEEKMW